MQDQTDENIVENQDSMQPETRVRHEEDLIPASVRGSGVSASDRTPSISARVRDPADSTPATPTAPPH